MRTPPSPLPQSPLPFTPAPAKLTDAPAIHALREALARWQQSRGITQWVPGEMSREEILEQVQRCEWWVLRPTGPLVAAVRLLAEDPQIWPDSATAHASYVHGLMVDRSASGHGLGAHVLAWAQSRAAALGQDWVRLDCVSTNLRLRAYYEQLGYQPRGEVVFGPDSSWSPVTRYEKPL